MSRLSVASAFTALLIGLSVAQGAAAAPAGPARPSSAQWLLGANSSVYLLRSSQLHQQQDLALQADRSFGRSSNLTYHNGPVMQTVKVYTIFWIPAGHSVASGYQSLLNRYFTDINATSFYNINTQYYQGSSPKLYMQNSSIFGGTWTDSAGYPSGRGSKTNPLLDSDIQNEVTSAIQANGWTANATSAFFVYTAQGVESCYDALDCTPGTSHPVFCAYHGNFAWSGNNVLYANMPYDETWGGSCRSFSVSPNGNIAADSEISTSSHEHFESATDPNGTAWYDSRGYEDGDKCAYNYGAIAANGSNMTLNGNPYIIQREWRNDTSGCAISR